MQECQVNIVGLYICDCVGDNLIGS
jgi:hypothetical protein